MQAASTLDLARLLHLPKSRHFPRLIASHPIRSAQIRVKDIIPPTANLLKPLMMQHFPRQINGQEA